MKLSTLITELAYPASTDNRPESLTGRIFSGLRQSLTNVRQVNADRAMRRELAELDMTILKDIGIADDEIYRVRARQEFTPRNWRD